MLKPIDGIITADFNQPRPLSNPGDHIHGAIDIQGNVNDIIKAPEDGKAFCYVGIRPKTGKYWPEMIQLHGLNFPYLNYFYDLYGGIIVLQVFDSTERNIIRTHVITHTYGNQIFNKSVFRKYSSYTNYWYEEKKDCRFPIIAHCTSIINVVKGANIGLVGNAGYSTGSHIHWEIHHGYKWERYEDRINPEDHI